MQVDLSDTLAAAAAAAAAGGLVGSGSLPVGRNGLSVMLLLCERLSNGEVRAGKKREGVRGGG